MSWPRVGLFEALGRIPIVMELHMQGKITHLEIGTQTAPNTSTFFSSLFEWPYSSMGEGGGWFKTPTCKIGMHPSDPKPGIVVYFSVSDIEAASIKVRELGGEASEISPDEPGFGRFCSCKDPEGVVFGLHQLPVNKDAA
jgi:predicted enzyme related to lactoylglutathione lyase